MTLDSLSLNCKIMFWKQVISSNNIEEKVFIRRLTLIPFVSKILFQFQHKQFPIIISFIMTINKSQGESLKDVGIYLPILDFFFTRTTIYGNIKVTTHE